MRAGTDCFDEADQMRDIFIEAETAIAQRDIAGVMPVGDVDIMVATVPRNSVAKCLDIGATSNTGGCTALLSFLKRNKVQNGVYSTTSSRTETVQPFSSTLSIPNAGR
jgi:hypothetical protein